MFRKKSLIAWFLCSALMFTLSFTWHGIILNDFNKISYQKPLFLAFLALLYILLGFIMAFGFSLISTKKFTKAGLALGVGAGLIVFLIVFVLGTSLSGGMINPLHASIDFIWQLIEQGAGGFCLGLVYVHYQKREMLFE
jgi:hypothetical protein